MPHCMEQTKDRQRRGGLRPTQVKIGFDDLVGLPDRPHLEVGLLPRKQLHFQITTGLAVGGSESVRGHGQQVKVSLAKPRTLEERKIIALSRRRTQLLQLVSQESNRLRQCMDTQAKALIQEMLKALKMLLIAVDSAIETCLESQAKTDPKIEVIRSVPAPAHVLDKVWLFGD